MKGLKKTLCVTVLSLAAFLSSCGPKSPQIENPLSPETPKAPVTVSSGSTIYQQKAGQPVDFNGYAENATDIYRDVDASDGIEQRDLTDLAADYTYNTPGFYKTTAHADDQTNTSLVKIRNQYADDLEKTINDYNESGMSAYDFSFWGSTIKTDPAYNTLSAATKQKIQDYESHLPGTVTKVNITADAIIYEYSSVPYKGTSTAAEKLTIGTADADILKSI